MRFTIYDAADLNARKSNVVNRKFLHTFVRKYLIVSLSPSASFTFGSHFRNFFALVMSGLRCFGSSCGSGLKTILLLDLVALMICSANWRMVSSAGLPMFTGKL